MTTLREYLTRAKAEKWAMGHFNFSTSDQLRAIVEVAAETHSPVMVGTSEGEDNFLGHAQSVALVESWRQAGYPVFLNADHHHSWEECQKALDAGYASILIDASKLSFEENVAVTKKVVDYARKIARSRKEYIIVEGEIGYLRGDSKVQSKVELSPNDYTKPEEAKEFIKLTGVDSLAIVFGNIHGITTDQEEHLDLNHLKKIVLAVPEVFIVLHGGSGLPPEEVQEAVREGIVNVHINTELRIAYQQALKRELGDNPSQATPYKFLGPSLEAVKGVVRQKILLFGSFRKA